MLGLHKTKHPNQNNLIFLQVLGIAKKLGFWNDILLFHLKIQCKGMSFF